MKLEKLTLDDYEQVKVVGMARIELATSTMST